MISNDEIKKLIDKSIVHGEFEIGSNAIFDKKNGAFYGFSWVTGPVFGDSIDIVLERMYKKAANRNFKKYRKVFIIDRARHDSGRYK